MKTKIAIAEDDHVTRKQYQQRFSFFEDIEIVAVADDGGELLEILGGLAKQKLPEIILLDIEMPKLNGIDTAVQLSEKYPEINILMLTVFKDEEKIFQSIKAGASGYLLKDSSTEEIIHAIEEIKNGGVPLSRSIARKILLYMQNSDLAKSSHTESNTSLPDFQLTTREIEILNAVVDGAFEAAIAEKLFISQHTVRTHVKNIYTKLQVHTRGELVKAAFKYNLINNPRK